MEWYTIAIILVVGLVSGFIIGHNTNSGNRKSRKLDEELQKTRQEMADYRTEVQQHFTKSAELVNELTASYCAVYEHLANGAQMLVGSKALPVGVASPAEMLTAQNEEGSLQAKTDAAEKEDDREQGDKTISPEKLRSEQVGEERVH